MSLTKPEIEVTERSFEGVSTPTLADATVEILRVFAGRRVRVTIKALDKVRARKKGSTHG